jgi:hypothetical protein
MWNSNLRILCVLVAAFTLLFEVDLVNVHAQVVGGTISGTVKDTSGRVIANVRVSVKNIATSVNREVTTNEEGFYSAPNLLPGTYVVTLSAAGFRTEVQQGITLTVGASMSLDQTLSVGSVTEKIMVQSEVPAVQLASSDISAVVNATTVRELPLNGRSWTDLAQLQPGVSAIHTQPDFSAGTDRGNRGFGQQLTISGARPQQNNYRLDGVSLNDYANGAPGSVLGGNLGVDAIQEFSVITSNYSAEYGKTSGGVVNAITRSGTNQIHGSAYEFLRNSKLDAKNYFDSSTLPIPPSNATNLAGPSLVRSNETKHLPSGTSRPSGSQRASRQLRPCRPPLRGQAISPPVRSRSIRLRLNTLRSFHCPIQRLFPAIWEFLPSRANRSSMKTSLPRVSTTDSRTRTVYSARTCSTGLPIHPQMD